MKHKSQSRSGRGASRLRPHQQNAARTGAPSGSNDLASVFGQALALHQAGQLPRAEALYRRILELDPDHFDSRHLLGIAVRHMEAALKINPRSFSAYNNRGVALEKLKSYDSALASYEAAIALKSDDAETFYNRGNVLKELKRHDEALASYDKAIALKSNYAGAFYNRGNALVALSRFEEAAASYQRTIALAPDHAQAWLNRGMALGQLRRLEEALANYNDLIARRPDHAGAFYNRGLVLAGLKRFEEALASYDCAIAIRPDDAEAFNNRGNALSALKRFEEALASYEKAIALDPACADAFSNRGNALRELKRPGEALASCEQAIALDPDHADAWINRGIALAELKRFEEALSSYDRAVSLKPGSASAFYNRGNTLRELMRFDQALADYDRAIGLKADYADAFHGRGVVLGDLERYQEALADYDRAIAFKPGLADAFYGRGLALAEMGHDEEAVASYRKAIALAPEQKFAFGVMAFCALKVCDWAQRDEVCRELRRHVTQRRSIISPFLLLGYDDDPALHLLCAQSYVRDRFGSGIQNQMVTQTQLRHARACPAHPGLGAKEDVDGRDKGSRRASAAGSRPGHDEPAPSHLSLKPGATRRSEKLRIAYLSGDFRLHAVAFLVAELFERHDRSRFEVIGISCGPDDGSDMRSRLAGAFDRFIDVRTKSDREVAQLLHALGIDIAIDLAGYTQHGRPGALAMRPAPIQVSYLGFPATTGADFIDYIIADAIVLPFDQQSCYSERIVHLPDTYQVNDSRRAIAARTPSREELGLPAQGVVFCSFNNTWKIAPPVFDVWMRLLHRVAGSVLWLRCDRPRAEANLRSEAAARGIDPARLVFADSLPDYRDHLVRHRAADLFLDTLPFNAHTTASDALWAGLPVLTCRGRTFAGRVAASLLNAVGMPQLVTDSLDQYEAVALRLAADPALLQGFRRTLEENRLHAPLFDTARFCGHIEAAYTTMWEIRQRGEPPRSFSVERPLHDGPA
jgi:protein O-GlcNAc transferase